MNCNILPHKDISTACLYVPEISIFDKFFRAALLTFWQKADILKLRYCEKCIETGRKTGTFLRCARMR